MAATRTERDVPGKDMIQAVNDLLRSSMARNMLEAPKPEEGILNLMYVSTRQHRSGGIVGMLYWSSLVADSFPAVRNGS